jgi:hypothetical protein
MTYDELKPQLANVTVQDLNGDAKDIESLWAGLDFARYGGIKEWLPPGLNRRRPLAARRHLFNRSR